MKYLRVIALVFFLISLVPVGAFCHDDHDKAADGHCVMICHSVCSHAVAFPNTPVVSMPLSSNQSLTAPLTSIYENPSLDRFKRPPIVSA